MPCVAHTERIQREMALEIFETRHELAIERGAQLIEPREYSMFGVALRLLQPGDEIAAHFGNEFRVFTPPYFRGAQVARLVQLDTARPQIGEKLCVDEIVRHAETAFGQLIDQARRRDRSPRRFASGRRLLRALTGLRRLAIGFLLLFFLGGSSMDPRHFAAPQRQA